MDFPFNNARDEYRYFLKNYVFPVIGIPAENNLQECENDNVPMGDKGLVYLSDRYVYFTNKDKPVFKINIHRVLSDENQKVAENILRNFYKISRFKLRSSGTAINTDYESVLHLVAYYKLAVQQGICEWVIGNSGGKLSDLFDVLENWSVKTYEGHKVTIGIILNPSEKATDDTVSWLKVLDNDFSALLTDCIHSIVEVDAECNLLRYLSATGTGELEQTVLDHQVPLRFTMTVKKFVTGNKIGIFLTTNGDIILAKGGAVRFVKRNRHWLNFGFEAFEAAAKNKSAEMGVSADLLKAIYASVLDVSFAHTGGIISVVNPLSNLTNRWVNETNDLSMPTLSPVDDLTNEKTDDELSAELANMKMENYEIDAALCKRKALISLVGEANFIDLDRKLRCELISIDGACILDCEGRVCACGAIIMNNSGSAGGGRKAATVKLSNNGIAWKISTDGYIEMYIDGRPKYSIK